MEELDNDINVLLDFKNEIFLQDFVSCESYLVKKLALFCRRKALLDLLFNHRSQTSAT